MFSSVQSFLWFFIPSVILIVLGILFEEKLVAFEARVKTVLFHKKRRGMNRAKLHKVPKTQRPQKAVRRGTGSNRSPRQAA